MPEGNIDPLTDVNNPKIMQKHFEFFDHTDKSIEQSADEKFVKLIKQPGLVLLGLVASIDLERDGVPQAVLDAQGGDIRVDCFSRPLFFSVQRIGQMDSFALSVESQYEHYQ